MEKHMSIHPSLARRTVLKGFGAMATAAIIGHRPAWSQSLDALVAAAKKEGGGTFYTAEDPTIAKNVVAAFKDKYGIDIDVLRLPSNTLAQRFTAEVENNKMVADLILSTEKPFMQRGTADGWFAKLDDLPALKAWPASALNGPVATVGHVPYSVTWNKNLVPEGIKRWQDLADPKWKGQLLMTDPRVMRVPLNTWYFVIRKAYGDDFMRKIGANAHFSPSVVPGLQQVAAGSAAIYVPSVHQVHVELAAKGAPIEEAFLEPTVTSDNLLAIVAKAPHPNIAQLLFNFFLTPEGQAINNKDGFSPLPNVPGTRPAPKTETVDADEVLRQVPQIVSLFGLS
jgi:iron(III) transport system substrate-binding protein